jgi:uncharacterized protein
MELHIIPIPGDEGPGKFIIYRPLAGLAFVGNQAMVDLACAAAADPALAANDAQGKALAFLGEVGFLQADPPPPIPAPTEFRPTTAVLLMTNRCQLRCTYCYAAAGEAPAETLTAAQGQAAIDYVRRSAQEQGLPHFEVSLHGGGEPTLAWTTLQACTEYARRQPLPARIGMTSNGIWSATQLAWIIANLDELSISLDGAPATQDRQRPFGSGQGSSKQVLRSIAALDRHLFNYGIRMTATAPWDRFPEDVRFICEQTGCRSIQVESAFNTQRGGHCQGEANGYQAFAAAFMAALDIANRAGRHLFYSGARLGQVAPTFCRAPYDALIVTPGGDLVSCYEVTARTHPLAGLSTVGRYDGQDVVVDGAARAYLHTLMAQRQEGCQNCFCYRTCAGDCYTRGFGAGPSGHLLRGPRCQLNQDLTRSLLLESIASGGGVWRNGQQPPQAVPVPVSRIAPPAARRPPSRPVRSALVVTSWWSNSLALACLQRLARYCQGREIYLAQAGKSAEQMARLRALLPPEVIELAYPEDLPQDDSPMREYLALTRLRDLTGAWFIDHDTFFDADPEPWFRAADRWFSEFRTCLCIGEPREGPGVTQPAYWVSPSRWPQQVVSFDPVPFAAKDSARRPDLYRHDGDVVQPQKDTLVRVREELTVRGLCSWFPLTAEAAARHGLPAFPAHTHLGGIHLYTGPLLVDRFRPWMEQTVARFDRFFAGCPPQWLQAEEPELLRRHGEFKAALAGSPSAAWRDQEDREP